MRVPCLVLACLAIVVFAWAVCGYEWSARFTPRLLLALCVSCLAFLARPRTVEEASSDTSTPSNWVEGIFWLAFGC